MLEEGVGAKNVAVRPVDVLELVAARLPQGEVVA
jgi:hypothetical protein